LQIQTDNIEEYFHRQPTQSEHLQEIIDLDHSLLPEGHPGHDRSRQSSVRECDPSYVPTWLGAHYLHRSYHWREHAGDINVLRPLRTFKLEKNGRGILPRHQDHWPRRSP
jgi:hypothetical protein